MVEFIQRLGTEKWEAWIQFILCKKETLWCLGAGRLPYASAAWSSSYLVDPASSHMLVSKIKPCMSKYKQFCTVKLRMAHYISYSLFDSLLLLG